MTCDPLPNTGLDAGFGPLLLLAIACLVAGGTMVLLARRGGRGAPIVVGLVLLLGGGATCTALGSAPAQAGTSAGTSGCSSSPSAGHLIVTQTSTMVGLAPGVAAVPITGRVENDSADGTYITAVAVEITSVTPGPGSSTGACEVGDYRLTAALMPVGRALAGGASTPFTGALIGFRNKATNQDACKGATIHLLYTVNPG